MNSLQSGRGGGAGPSQQQRQRQRWRRSGGGGGDVIDLTSESLPEDEIEVLRSTVARVAPRSAKRPRAQQQQAAAGAGPWQHLSPTSKQLLAQLRAAPAAPPPPPPEPEGPKCGICLEVGAGLRGRVGKRLELERRALWQEGALGEWHKPAMQAVCASPPPLLPPRHLL